MNNIEKEYDVSELQEMSKTAKQVVSIFKSKSLPAEVKSGRSASAFKAVALLIQGEIQDILSSVGISAKIENVSPVVEKKISGTYSVKLAEITKSYQEFKIGDRFFVYTKKTEKGRITNKFLTPDKLRLVSVYRSPSSLDANVVSAVKNLKLDEDLEKILIGSYLGASASKNTKIDLPTDLMQLVNNLSTPEKSKIGKDFGEIISLRWCLNQDFAKNSRGFGFSQRINEPLIDYFIESSDGTTINISAKYAKGAAPALKDMITLAEQKVRSGDLKFNSEETVAFNSLKMISGGAGTISERVLNASLSVNLPGIEIIRSALKKPKGTKINLSDIKNDIDSVMKKTKSREDRKKLFLDKYSKFYDAVGSYPDNSSFDKLFYENTASITSPSILISPMATGLVKFLNSNIMYKTVLNKICKSLDVNQVYLDFTRTGMTFEKKIFSESEFRFHWNSNASNANLGGLKFEMVRK